MSSPSPTGDFADENPSTSSFSAKEAISAQIEKLKHAMMTGWGHVNQKLEELKQRYRENNFDTVVEHLFGDAKAAEWKAGWERVKDIYRHEHSMEWYFIKRSALTGMVAGFVSGGLGTIPETMRRFDVAVTGKLYQDVGYLRRRQWDYIIKRFMGRGTIEGCQLGIALIFVLGLTFGFTAFREEYSLLHFPLATAPVAALTAKSAWRGWGLIGFQAALYTTLVPTSFLLLGTLCGCAYYGCWPNDGYWRLKACVEQRLRQEEAYKCELDAYQKSRELWSLTRRTPWLKSKMEKERKLGTWRYREEEGGLDQLLDWKAPAGDDTED